MMSMEKISESGMQAIYALGPGLAFVALFLILLMAASYTADLLTRKSLKGELVQADNGAVGLALAGYYIAVAIIFSGAAFGPSSGDLVADLISVGGYTLLGILFLNISRAIFERLLFRKADDLAEIIDNQNMSMAAVTCGSYIATGLVAGGAVSGLGGSWVSSIVFFLLGQIALLLVARAYDWVTPYPVEDELVDGNVAAGLAFSGTLVALGLILMHAAAGDFTSWEDSIIVFLIDAVAGIIALLFIREAISRLLVSGDLNKEIALDRNVAAGFIEAAAIVAVGGAIAVAL